MLFGMRVTFDLVMYGGYLTFAVLVFQTLVGKRVIRFKGRTHQKVHRWLAYMLLTLAAVHGFLALVIANQWRIGG